MYSDPHTHCLVCSIVVCLAKVKLKGHPQTFLILFLNFVELFISLATRCLIEIGGSIKMWYFKLISDLY